MDVLICFLEDCKEFEYFEMAHNINLILIDGYAGSGKTVLALELARRKVLEGKNVLFLYYSVPNRAHSIHFVLIYHLLQ